MARRSGPLNRQQTHIDAEADAIIKADAIDKAVKVNRGE
jgi:hypothetical protein